MTSELWHHLEIEAFADSIIIWITLYLINYSMGKSKPQLFFKQIQSVWVHVNYRCKSNMADIESQERKVDPRALTPPSPKGPDSFVLRYKCFWFWEWTIWDQDFVHAFIIQLLWKLYKPNMWNICEYIASMWSKTCSHSIRFGYFLFPISFWNLVRSPQWVPTYSRDWIM